MMFTSNLVESQKSKKKNSGKSGPGQNSTFHTKKHVPNMICWFAKPRKAHKVCSQAATWWAARCIAMQCLQYLWGKVLCSTSTVAYKRSGCTYSSAAWPRQSSMHSPRIYPCPRLVSVIARRNCSRASCSAGKLASICRYQQRMPKDLRCGCCSLRVLELHSSGHQSQRECLVSFGRRKACDLKQFAWGS